jgi:type VI secretion system secreted protein Hcp
MKARYTLTTGLLAGLVFTLASAASAATFARVSIQGAKQDWFRGEGPGKASNPPTMPLVNFRYELVIPRDPASGLPTGARQHKPIVITREWGPVTSQILQALLTNEVLTSVTVEFVKTNANGQEYVYHTVKLTNATITSLRHYTQAGGPGAKHSAGGNSLELEEVSFSFQKIEIENKDGKTVAMDDWETRP